MKLKEVLRQVPDPRGKQGQDYALRSILSLMVVSFLCGSHPCEAGAIRSDA